MLWKTLTLPYPHTTPHCTFLNRHVNMMVTKIYVKASFNNFLKRKTYNLKHYRATIQTFVQCILFPRCTTLNQCIFCRETGVFSQSFLSSLLVFPVFTYTVTCTLQVYKYPCLHFIFMLCPVKPAII